MKKEALSKIAEGHKLIQEGYLLLAQDNKGMTSIPKAEEELMSEGPEVTVEDVRAVLAVKTRDGKTQQVKELLNQMGADKLSSVPKDKLTELKAKAEVL
ncbi:hypothetical protein EDD76_102247 [Kineothrix alysoides]|uniref:Uncharacterized protein n=1 Tax=Kineothrix alysoides TaxID=1469948 RepID=A0A4R1R4Z7_9FIRM|nr:hypothetical protein [Kineothrix alysoides]TCL60549.1 hypothetical protein EDD76_102247 [Kineothrix alysoides]